MFDQYKNIDDFRAPFDMLAFPSMGLFYPDHKSEILVRYLTGVEENILSAPLLAQTGKALDFVLNAVIMDKNVDPDKLLVADKNAIILFLRATAFGTNYPLYVNCNHCHTSGKTSFDLEQMVAKDIYSMPDEDGCFMYVLPKTKIAGQNVEIKFRPLTYGDEKKLVQEIEMTKKKGITKSITLRLALQIQSINKITDKEFIYNFINKIPIIESKGLQDYIERVEPGIVNTVSIMCPNCTKRLKQKFEINSEFLGITDEYKHVLWEETFLLPYYSRGGVTELEAQNMATSKRHWQLKRISDEVKKTNDAEKKAHEASQRKAH